MRQDRQPVTGADNVADAASPVAALTAFYRAFNARDHALMAANWLQTDAASMMNPLGGITQGWASIREVYKRIFDGAARVSVMFHDYTLHVTEDLFLAAGRERGLLQVDGRRIELAIRTTRLYTAHEGGWKQLHHHGSMDDPGLLSEYRRILLNNDTRSEK